MFASSVAEPLTTPLLVVVCALSLIVPAQAAQRVAVTAHAQLELICDSVAVSTVALHPGDELDFHVSKPLVADGYVVVAEDARAVGHIVEGGGTEIKQHVFGVKVEQHPLTYALDYVISADGGKIKLDPTVTRAPEEKIAQAHLFFGAKSQTNLGGILNKGTKVSGFIDHTVHVMAKQRAGANGGYDE